MNIHYPASVATATDKEINSVIRELIDRYCSRYFREKLNRYLSRCAHVLLLYEDVKQKDNSDVYNACDDLEGIESDLSDLVSGMRHMSDAQSNSLRAQLGGIEARVAEVRRSLEQLL